MYYFKIIDSLSDTTEVLVPQENSPPENQVITLIDSDSEVDGEISIMSEETLAELERQKDLDIAAAQKGRESSLLEQIKVLRRNHGESMREWQVILSPSSSSYFFFNLKCVNFYIVLSIPHI